MGKVIDLDERRQIQALRRAMVDSMARLVRLTRRYGQALAELQQDSPDRPAATDAQKLASTAPDKPAPER